jgi:hypothetical protein
MSTKTKIFVNEFLTACERQKNKKGGEYFDKQLLGKGRG